MAKLFFIFVLVFQIASCQTKNTEMTTEKFDVETYQKRKEKDPWYGDIIILEDSTKIQQSGPDKKGGASEIITPPKPAFYKIRKSYHKATNTLELEGREIGDMSIGIWQFFNKKGKLVREVDEDKKLDGHDYHKALEFLEKDGWIDIKTGKGREHFSLDYEKDIWYITIIGDMWNGYLETYYEVDANTLKTLKKKETQRGEE